MWQGAWWCVKQRDKPMQLLVGGQPPCIHDCYFVHFQVVWCSTCVLVLALRFQLGVSSMATWYPVYNLAFEGAT